MFKSRKISRLRVAGCSLLAVLAVAASATASASAKELILYTENGGTLTSGTLNWASTTGSFTFDEPRRRTVWHRPTVRTPEMESHGRQRRQRLRRWRHPRGRAHLLHAERRGHDRA